MSLLEKYDAKLKSSLEGILNISLSRDAWLQSSLPVKMGGLGIRYSVNMATPCFLALLSSSLSYLESLLPTDIFFNTTTIIAETQKSLQEKDLSTRRDALNNDILQALRPAGVLCIREPPGCSRCDGKRPDGQTL
ncbi:hypothetical protein ILUMI_14892, partial [Ignelater luminosus]